MIPLHLSSPQARQIESEGVNAYPNECCGILFGIDRDGRRVVQRLQPVANVFDPGERFHRFSISAEQLLAAEKEAAGSGQLVVGFYHSHPDHPARPSEYDRTHAWPFYSYIIVSIAGRDAVDMTSWLLDDQTETFFRQDIIEERNEP